MLPIFQSSGDHTLGSRSQLPSPSYLPTHPAQGEPMVHLSGVVAALSAPFAAAALLGRHVLPLPAALVLWHIASTGLLVSVAASEHLAGQTTWMMGKVGGCGWMGGWVAKNESVVFECAACAHTLPRACHAPPPSPLPPPPHPHTNAAPRRQHPPPRPRPPLALPPGPAHQARAPARAQQRASLQCPWLQLVHWGLAL